MVAWCELPLEICRIQWLDMQDCHPVREREERYDAGFKRLCEAIEQGRIDLDGAQARLRKALKPEVFSFDADFEKHLSRFEGRKWLLDQVDSWLTSESARPVFWIVGPPRSGKDGIVRMAVQVQKRDRGFSSLLVRKQAQVRPHPLRPFHRLPAQLAAP
jgi:hypothetical protein